MRWLAVAVLLGTASVAAADPLRVVVRRAGGDDQVLERLAGHVVDLEIEPVTERGPLEKTLDAQIAAASELAERHDARAVVWFEVDGAEVIVVVATPGERRVFVRTLDAGDASASAEAAAQAARSALRALELGGTIGVELPPEVVIREAKVELPPPPPPPRTPLRWHGALGWQAALDGGADPGAHAAWQRIGAARDRWGIALGLSLGPPLRRVDDELTVELARGSICLAAEHRRGAWRFGLGAGAVLYHRATVEVPDGLEPTASTSTVSGLVAPELRWSQRWVEVVLGLDVVISPPELAVQQDSSIRIINQIGIFQPRLGIGLILER
jgi:hypothetical protein